jgi:lipoprotein signal peptidase
MAYYYSKKAVLTNLPLAIAGNVGEWIDRLLKSLLQDINNSLNMWINQLCLYFVFNISKVLAKANTLQHSFIKENTLSIH